jgi:hypothetical protein
MVEAAARLMGKQGCLPPQSSQSFFWVEEAPGHGANLVEEVEDLGCMPFVGWVRAPRNAMGAVPGTFSSNEK